MCMSQEVVELLTEELQALETLNEQWEHEMSELLLNHEGQQPPLDLDEAV